MPDNFFADRPKRFNPKTDVPFPFTPALATFPGDMQDIQETTEFLKYYKTPQDIEQYKNFIIHSQFGEVGVESPFKETETGKAEFDTTATYLPSKGDETPEQRTFKELRNYLVLNKGKVEQPNFIMRAAGNSMTSGWVELLTGDKLGGIYNQFDVTEDGIFLGNKKLNLNDVQSKILSDFMARVNGQDIDRSFFDKVIETAASLTFDLPLLALTGGISSGIMKGSQVTRALMTSTDLAPRFLGQILQQSVNFNLLGVPQTVNALEQKGVGGALKSIFHSALMGTLAAGTGTAGVGIGRGVGKLFLTKNPAIREELAGLGGSFGFGYLSGKFMGDSDEDAIATGLGFAATHFTNPRAYSRVIQEQRTKPLRIVTDKGEFINGRFSPDYFIEEKGTLQQIDKRAFMEEGKLVPIDVEPLQITPEIKEGMVYYNELPNYQRLSYGDALKRDREQQNGKKLYDNIVKGLDENIVKEYGSRLRTLAEVVSSIVVGDKIRKTFGSWKLPDDIELRKDLISITNKNKIPYDAFKEWLINDIKDYIIDPVKYQESLETYQRYVPISIAQKMAYNPKILKDMIGVLDKLRNTIMPSENLTDYNNRLLPEFTSDKIRLPNGIMYAKSKPAIKEEIKSEALKVGDTVKFESAGQEQSGKIKNFTDEYKNVDVELADKRTVNIPVNKLLEAKDIKEEKVETPVEKVETEKVVEEPTIETKVEEPAIKSLVEDVKPDKEEIEENKKVEDLPETSKQIEPTKPIKEISQERINTTSREIVEAISKRKGKGFDVKQEEIAKPLAELYELAQRQADAKNIELEKAPDNLTKTGKLKENKKYTAEDYLIKALATGDARLTSNEIAVILQQINPDKYSGYTGKNVDDVFKSGKLKDVPRYRGVSILPEVKPEIPIESEEIKQDILEQTQGTGLAVNVPEAGGTRAEMIATEKARGQLNKELEIEESVTKFTEWALPRQGEGKTVKELLDEAVEAGIINKAGRDYVAGIYGKNVVNKYSITDANAVRTNIKRRTEVQKVIDEFNTTFGQEYGITAKIELIPQVATEGQLKAANIEGGFNIEGVTRISLIDPSKDIEIAIDPRYGKTRTFEHEKFHGLSELILDKNTYYNLLKKRGWDGAGDKYNKNVSRIRAEELIADAYADWRAGTGPQLSGFKKLKAFFEKMMNFFKGNEFLTNEYAFFRDLANGKIQLRKRIHSNVKKYYDPKTDKMSIEDVQELFSIAAAPSPKDTYVQKEALYEWDRTRPDRLNPDRMLDKMLKSTLYSDIPTAAKDKIRELWQLTTPPAYAKYKMPKFADIRETGENWIIRKAVEAGNRIWRENWLIKEQGKSFFRNLPQETQEGLMGKYQKYTEDMYESKGEPLTADKLYKEYKFTEQEIKVDKAYQATKDKTVEVRKLANKYILQNFKNVTESLNKRKFTEFFPELKDDIAKGEEISKETYGKANDILEAEPMRKEQVVDYLSEKMYDYGDAHYLNLVRPSTPDTWIIDMANADGKRRNMYAINEKDAKAKVEEWRSKGYEVTEQGFYRIGDILKQGEYWNRLTARQLQNLAALGHIPLDNPIIAKLEESLKAGTFEQHTTEREFIPGMEFTSRELEENLERFVHEGSGLYRMIGNMEMTRSMESWLQDLNVLNKSTMTPISDELRNKYDIKGSSPTDSELKKLQSEYDYATKYVNNITHSDKSIADGIRKYTYAYYLAMRASFMFQQPFQVFQKVLPVAMAESKNGNKTFWSTLTESAKVMQFIRANQKGLSEQEISSFGYGKELYDIYNTLTYMKKMGKTGVEELSDQMGEIDYHYATGPGKWLESAIRMLNIPSAGLEKFTRVQSMLTFYNIGKEKGLAGEKLTNYVADKIDETMDQWGVGGRIPLLASKKPHTRQEPLLKALDKSFITFKTYATHNLALYEKLMRNHQWGALGVKLLVGLGLHGATKFPLMAGMFMLADLFTENDTEHEALQMLDDLNGIVPGLGSITSRGVFSLADLDVSRLFDERTIFPTDLVSNLKSYSTEGKLAEAMISAPYGFVKDIVDGSQGLYEGLKTAVLNEATTDVERRQIKKNLVKVLPLFLRNVATVVYQWEKDGIMVRNNVIVKKEDLTWKDVLYKTLSFQPLDVSKAVERQIYGLPNKLNRIEGEISELKKIRKEIASSTEYEAIEKTLQLHKVAEMLRDAQERKIKMMRTKEYKEAVSTGLLN